MTFQLWVRDEYGYGNIVATSTDIQNLIDQAKKEVSNHNVDNVLTAEEKRKSWEAYFVDLVDENNEVIEDGVYAGLDSTGQHNVYSVADDEYIRLKDVDAKVRLYLGHLDREDWYATDEKGNMINTLTHSSLINKPVYFIKKVKGS